MNTLKSQESFSRLDELAYDEKAVVYCVDAPESCACRLRAMGLCEGASICILHTHDPAIVKCDETRMAICRSLMKHITVCKHTVAGKS